MDNLALKTEGCICRWDYHGRLVSVCGLHDAQQKVIRQAFKKVGLRLYFSSYPEVEVEGQLLWLAQAVLKQLDKQSTKGKPPKYDATRGTVTKLYKVGT